MRKGWDIIWADREELEGDIIGGIIIRILFGENIRGRILFGGNYSGRSYFGDRACASAQADEVCNLRSG